MRSSQVVAVVMLWVLFVPATVGAEFIVVDGPIDQLTQDGYCSLREALRAAIEEDPLWSVQHGCVPGNGDDTILLPDGWYSQTWGAFEITGDANDITIEPLNSSSTAEDVILSGSSDTRVAWVHFQTGDVTFRRLTLTNGRVGDHPSDRRGGGLLAEVVEVTLDRCSIEDNFAERGGGIYAYESVVTIEASSFSDNYADAMTAGTFNGGAIYAENSIIHATNSTFSYNNAALNGGALFLNAVSAAWLRHVTITDNNCGFGDFVNGDGGGIVLAINADLNLAHTIIAGNHDLTNGATKIHDCAGPFGNPTSYNFNIVGDASGCGIVAQADDHFGTSANPVDPGLGPLTTNVRGTKNHLPLATSLAVGGGSLFTGVNFFNCDAAGDQRGVTRPKCVNDPTFCVCDVGAVELESTDLIFADGFESGTTSAWN